MSENGERVLLHVKLLNHRIYPTFEGVRTGASLRVVARTAPDGRVTVSGSVSHRVHRMRASGKVFRYWQTVQGFSLLRTKAGLVALRVLANDSQKNCTQHLFAGGEYQLAQLLRELGEQALLNPIRPHEWDPLYHDVRVVQGPIFEDHGWSGIQAQMSLLLQDLQGEALRLLGDLPVTGERFPLLREVSARRLGHSGLMHFLDAEDYKAVAENVFGKTRYRKPLAREIQRLAEHMLARPDWRSSHDMSVLNWFRLFRGLVPIDWIIESMRRTENNHFIPLTPAEFVQARALFRRVPRPILGRILAQPIAQSVRIIRDTVRDLGDARVQLRDLDLLPELIKARGQRRIRGARDLETLVRSMPVARVDSRSLARSNQAISAVIDEANTLREMQSYNAQIARLPGRDLPVASWELWKDPQFRQAADEFLVEHRRELMTAEQREREARAERHRQERLSREKKRAAWAADVAEKLDGMRVDEFQLVVARDADTLARWGVQLNNCIAGYASMLGLDVFVAVIDDQGDSAGRVRLNIEINHEMGIMQFLGTNNRDAVKELEKGSAQRVLDAITGNGIPVHQHALGLQQLALPGRDAVAA
ncbi:PcfJ domain-containing protein [Streptomyces sp. NBC_01768]|uniref:PcfJ domain-containing protein n=1 Tax=Streptomyces sp. NBC_01768 TaxID=2975938 RepID=UPI002DD7B552|nr:PcfJ domain-containing protein [Streptomyces sp. NBC_01768]WSC32250.1 PcfJ domain-containing protein [Streptomyces sp. NBC_01768]